jgi:2,4-dienoyl-CoA reductase-like NADH-dependent reductase (Old Yellow Enzyme family)
MNRLFDFVSLGSFEARNRVVMAPMTRRFSPGGAPGADVKSYYVRRAEAGVGVIMTEGLEIEHGGSVYHPAIPNFFEADALIAWRDIFAAIQAAGAKIVPQFWHVGGARHYEEQIHRPQSPSVAPSGFYRPGEQFGEPMTSADIEAVIDAYAKAARTAFEFGCDGIEIHGAHGYLIDEFFWAETNLRTDSYGGDLGGRSRFACDIVRECRRRTAPNFPIFFRFSQFKLQNYGAKLAATPQELEAFLSPLVDAGVDIFDCSTRRFWVPEFENSDLNLAGWTKKLTGKPSMTVGSVGLEGDVIASLRAGSTVGVRLESLDRLEAMLTRGDFDLVGVGRALLGDSHWVEKVRSGETEKLQSFAPEHLLTLS